MARGAPPQSSIGALTSIHHPVIQALPVCWAPGRLQDSETQGFLCAGAGTALFSLHCSGSSTSLCTCDLHGHGWDGRSRHS